MCQIDRPLANPVPRRIEDMPITLLDTDGQVLLGSRFQLAYFVLLMLCQVGEAFGPFECPQGQPTADIAAHRFLPSIVGHYQDQVIAQRPQSGTLHAFAVVDALNQFRNGLY